MRRGRAWALRLHWLGMLLVGLLALMLLTFSLALAQETKETKTKKPWTGKLADGREINRADLDRFLHAHALWLHRVYEEGKQAGPSSAELAGAALFGAGLRGADLRGANLSRAYLGRADLSKAHLGGANLKKAYLESANIEEAELWGANLSESNLFGANLSRANLRRADLSGTMGQGANLSGCLGEDANLSLANLALANLSGASLWRANLSGINLYKANLRGALLGNANLSLAKFRDTDLSKANLRDADLSGADLSGANLSETNFHKANLSGAIFEPKPGTFSELSNWLGVKGLSALTYRDSSYALVDLREAYKKAGMREPERELTYALNHNRRVKLWEKPGILNKLESLFHLVCFEWTCQYGMNPGRPLGLLGLGIFLFTPFYLLALRSRGPETGIWLVLPPDRILGQGSKVRPFKLTGRTPFRPLPLGRWPRLKSRLWRSLRRVRLAFYFSLLSAFNLGWRDLNVGNWISRVQKLEYNLKATGWVRTVAGLQSLLSVYLLALWVLTYFGRPFD